MTIKTRFSLPPEDAAKELPFEEPFTDQDEVGCPSTKTKSFDFFFLRHIRADIWLYEISHLTNGDMRTVIVLEYPDGSYIWNTDIRSDEWYVIRRNKINILTLFICNVTQLPIF